MPSSPTNRPTLTKKSSTVCSLRRATASRPWRIIGLDQARYGETHGCISITSARCGLTATGSLTPSIATCLSTNSRSRIWPAICCPKCHARADRRHRLRPLQRVTVPAEGGSSIDTPPNTSSRYAVDPHGDLHRDEHLAPGSLPPSAPSATITSSIRSRRRNSISSTLSSIAPPIRRSTATSCSRRPFSSSPRRA